MKFDVGGFFVHEPVLRVVPEAQPPLVQPEVSLENLCVSDLVSALLARAESSDVGILQDFPAGYDGVYILWVVTGGLLLAALLIAAFFSWVRGSALTPMPMPGAVCGRLNPPLLSVCRLFRCEAWFAAMVPGLFCEKDHFSRSHQKFRTILFQVVIGFAMAAAASACITRAPSSMLRTQQQRDPVRLHLSRSCSFWVLSLCSLPWTLRDKSAPAARNVLLPLSALPLQLQQLRHMFWGKCFWRDSFRGHVLFNFRQLHFKPRLLARTCSGEVTRASDL